MGRNGMTVVKTDNTNKEVTFVNGDTLEVTKLSKMINHKKEYNEMEQKRTENKQRMLARKKRKWKKYTTNTFTYIGVRSVIIGGVIWGMTSGMIHPNISIPVIIYCFGAACIRFGVWFGYIL